LRMLCSLFRATLARSVGGIKEFFVAARRGS
jgi:hypothetical protein